MLSKNASMRLRALALGLVTATTVALPVLAGDEAAPAAAAPAGPPPPAPTPRGDQEGHRVLPARQGRRPHPHGVRRLQEDGQDSRASSSARSPWARRPRRGIPLIAYVKFFVPKGGKYEDLKIKFLLNGEVRSTSDFTVSEAWTGYANYKQTTASKAGTWEMQVLRGDTVITSAKIAVE